MKAWSLNFASPPKKFLKINNVLDFIFAIIVASLVYLSIILILIMFFMCFRLDQESHTG